MLERFKPGLAVHKLLLKMGIILMRVQLSVVMIVGAGPLLVMLAVGSIAFGIIVVEVIGRFLNGGASKMTSLVAAGASVCGVSAVVGVAGSIDVKEEHTAYAVGTVLLLDAVTLAIFPAAGRVLTSPDAQSGIWAGLSLFSTGSVTAVGFAYSEVADQWATLTKIIKNALIGILAVGYSMYWMNEPGSEDANQLRTLWNNFPKYLAVFCYC